LLTVGRDNSHDAVEQGFPLLYRGMPLFGRAESSRKNCSLGWGTDAVEASDVRTKAAIHQQIAICRF
jgi:hypothetical protein